MFNAIKELLFESDSELNDSAEEIKRQKQFYESIIDSTPDLVFILDTNYRFIFVNDAFLELMGLTEEELLGKSLQEVSSPPKGPNRYEQELEQVINTKKTIQGESFFHHNQLGRRAYHYIFVPILDGQGEVKAVAGTSRDITERKQAEQALHYNEEKYRTLVENFPHGAVGLFDKDIKYTAVGGELVDSSGVNPEDRIGLKVTELYPKEIIDEVEPYFKAALEGKANTFETEFRGRYLFAHTLPIKNDEGEVIAGMLVVQDITERWQAQRALRKSEEKYRSLFEKMEEGFCIIQMEFDDNEEPTNFHYLETNPAFKKQAGLNISEGDNAKEVLPNFGEEMLKRNGKVALTGEPYHRELHVEEVSRWLELSAFRIGEPEERKVAILLQDITERKKVQQDLKTMNETLEERVEERTKSLLSYQSQLRSLASQLSQAEEKERHRLAGELHDNLGQMLAVNKLKMDMLKKDYLTDETLSALEDIKHGMEDAIIYTRNLMSDLKPPPSLNKEDIRAGIKWLAEKMKKHNLTVVVKDDGQPMGSSEEIQTTVIQAVREVLFNVIKHSGVDEAYINMKRLDVKAQITIEDKGQGFDVEAQKSALVEGGEFGLFNIQERIDLLGGNIKIDSEPGAGTKVTLVVPLVGEKETTSDTSSGKNLFDKILSDTQETTQQIKVMLVDDHQMIREGLKKIVNTEKDLTVVAEASDGREAIEEARKSSPDIIVMDVDMPVMNGIDATKKVITSMPEVRVIGLSFHNHAEAIKSMRDAGASAFLSKEEAFETLCATIRSEALTKE